jgi:hypothetical protein
MRKLLSGMLFVAMGMGVSMMAQAAITGSSHDFTDGLKGKSGNTGAGTAVSEAWNGRNEICRVCHVPHDHSQAAQRYSNGLLWNHGVSTATYTMYDNTWSSTLNGVQSAQPDGTAKLCLGCHDGSVAIDTFDKYAGGTIFFDGTATGYSTGYKVPGFADGGNLDLRGTHPISIAFPAADANEFTDPGVATWASGDTVASTLDNGKIQCSTCHDVHSQEVVAGSHLLRAAQTVAQGGVASGLCLTCHVK